MKTQDIYFWSYIQIHICLWKKKKRSAKISRFVKSFNFILTFTQDIIYMSIAKTIYPPLSENVGLMKTKSLFCSWFSCFLHKNRLLSYLHEHELNEKWQIYRWLKNVNLRLHLYVKCKITYSIYQLKKNGQRKNIS